MSKHSAIRRASKKRKKEKETKERKKRLSRKGSDFDLIELPNPFKHLTDEQRDLLIQKVHKKGVEDEKKSIDELLNILDGNNPLVLLSVLSVHSLVGFDGNNGIKRLSRDSSLTQFHIEYLAGLALRFENWNKPLPSPEIIQNTISALRRNSDSHSLQSLNPKLIGESKDELGVSELRESVKMHTSYVRNWGYPSQVRSISKELYGYFDSNVKTVKGWTLTSLISIFETIVEEVEHRLSGHFERLRNAFQGKSYDSIIDNYFAEFRISSDENISAFKERFPKDQFSAKDVKAILLSHSELFLPTIFSVNTANLSDITGCEIEQCKSMLESFSLSMGELSDFNIDHLHLGNPIRMKPAIRMENDSYFIPIPNLFFSFIIPCLESVLDSIHVDVSARRSKYLEAKIEEIIKRRFASALCIPNFKWQKSEVTYENDLLVFIDSHLIIIEAKSHSISQSALRGAPERLKKHLKQIVVESGEQSYRLEQEIFHLIGLHTNDRTQINLGNQDFSTVRNILRVSVSLENIAGIQAELSQIERTGWFRNPHVICPCISLSDFEIVFDLIEHPVQIMHYLKRRSELARRVNIHGDEIDYLGMYVDTHLDFGDECRLSNTMINLVGRSKKVDAYYEAKDEGIILPKPVPKLSRLFDSWFCGIEKRAMFRWTEVGVILNHFSPSDQKKIEHHLEVLEKVVRKQWSIKGHKNILVMVPDGKRGYSLAVALFCDKNIEREEEFFSHAAELGLEESEIEACIVVTMNIDNSARMYSKIALSTRSGLK